MLFHILKHRVPVLGRTLATASSQAAMPPPLEGLKLLDLSRVLAAPMATMLLADLGCARLHFLPVLNTLSLQ
jgi:succinate--hydroxymethylglutarate CoA-transferase